MDDKGPTLGYWDIRGLVELGKLIMEFSGKPYQMKYYKYGPAPGFSRESWQSVRDTIGLDFPNLPYLIDGEVQVTESMNIYLYLIHKYAPELMGKTAASKAKVLEGLCFLRGVKDAITGPCYNPDPSKAPEAVKNQAKQIELVEAKLGDREWFEGDSPTVADLLLMEIIDQMQMITKGSYLGDHPVLAAHHERTRNIPNIKAYKQSGRFFEGPFNGVMASTNNVPADYWK